MKKIITYGITILLSLAIGIGGTYFYMNSKNNNVIENKNTANTNNITDTITKNTENNTSNEGSNTTISYDTASYNLEKLLYTNDCSDPLLNYLNNSIVKNNDIKNIDAYAAINAFYFNNKTSISESEWNQKIIEYFGEDYKYDPTSFDVSNLCANYIYNKDKKQYDYRETACGCTSGPTIEYYIKNISSENNSLIINLKVLFPESDSNGTIKYYSDFNKTKELNIIYDDNGFADNIQSNFEQGGNYKIVMNKVQDDIYSFSYSEYLD